jgi:hypothetical protein
MNQQISIANQAQVERSFLTRTFLWMTLGLFVTAVVSYVVTSSETLLNLVFGNPMITFGLMIGDALVFRVRSIDRAHVFGDSADLHSRIGCQHVCRHCRHVWHLGDYWHEYARGFD